MGHDFVGTEHLLLGLLEQRSAVAGRVLDSLGVAARHVRPEIERIVGRGEKTSAAQLEFTPLAEAALARSMSEARDLGCDDAGTEHLLLALADERDSLARRILMAFDISPEQVRAEVAKSAG